MMNNYDFKVYEDIDITYPPILGVVVVNNKASIVVVESKTTNIIGKFVDVPYTEIDNLIFYLINRFMPNGIINVMRNYEGLITITNLIRIDLKSNLYSEEKKKSVEKRIYGKLYNIWARVREYGIDTSNDTSKKLMKILTDYMAGPKYISIPTTVQLKRIDGGIDLSFINDSNITLFAYLSALYVCEYMETINN